MYLINNICFVESNFCVRTTCTTHCAPPRRHWHVVLVSPRRPGRHHRTRNRTTPSHRRHYFWKGSCCLRFQGGRWSHRQMNRRSTSTCLLLTERPRAYMCLSLLFCRVQWYKFLLLRIQTIILRQVIQMALYIDIYVCVFFVVRGGDFALHSLTRLWCE